ncbi:hypothetical protein NEOLEDRAFT_879918 [Neolentinus lepideus HHB14362 ss-1]|uniref:Uncharacterized protein n=1 Tax=Neolentinus lepideus HHB14362 ss-1 TaxID=1314782 RepID=A0A165NXH9_9AGAM|nr:hypothetical protein NEOLEDRAFT_879918 [Neolentinus lepideus HHB14362 ss-1]
MSVAVNTSGSSSGRQKPPRKKASRKVQSASAEDPNEMFFEDDPILDDDRPDPFIDDEVEVIEVPPAALPPPPRPPRSTARAPQPQASNYKASEVDSLEQCYQNLCDIRRKIALREGLKSAEDVLHDECLQMLCCTSIKDLGDFRRVLSDAYPPDEAGMKWRHYEQHFLDVCITKSIAELEESSKRTAREGTITTTKSFNAAEMQTRYAYSSKPPSRRKPS